MKRVKVFTLEQLRTYPVDTKIEIYNVGESINGRDRDRRLAYNDHDTMIVDDSGGFFVDQDFIILNQIIACIEEGVKKFTPQREAIPPRLRVETLMRFKSRCVLCGTTSNRARLEVDHIIPVAKGGRNEPENLQVLCATCNKGKGAM